MVADPPALRRADWERGTAAASALRRPEQAAEQLAALAAAADLDGIAFIHANWALHARIADVTPNAMLRSFYLSLLEIIESHTLAVQPLDDQPLPEHIQSRHDLHAALVDAIAARDEHQALALIPGPPG
ncbi:FCD domain-containing protein [Dactylosporangium sp. NPDC000521]|uniref:FCD domain-containing protein n=1 Tax=Dactylosporangium sp. NPDC000521 TaxID=3363975 RepID=UPI0036BC4CD7